METTVFLERKIMRKEKIKTTTQQQHATDKKEPLTFRIFGQVIGCQAVVFGIRAEENGLVPTARLFLDDGRAAVGYVNALRSDGYLILQDDRRTRRALTLIGVTEEAQKAGSNGSGSL